MRQKNWTLTNVNKKIKIVEQLLKLMFLFIISSYILQQNEPLYSDVKH